VIPNPTSTERVVVAVKDKTITEVFSGSSTQTNEGTSSTRVSHQPVHVVCHGELSLNGFPSLA